PPRPRSTLFPYTTLFRSNTLAVAERCNLTLDFNQFHLPRYVVPSEHTLDSYLHELAHEGLKRRYASPGDTVEARLASELAVIEKMGFAGYFLVVWDFIRYAREQGIAVGPGRGSAGRTPTSTGSPSWCRTSR